MSRWAEWGLTWRRQPGFVRMLWAFAFCLPMSIAAGQICLVAALILWIASEIRSPRRGRINPFTPLLALFALWAVWVSVHGGRPMASVPKLHRLAWFLLIYLVPSAAARSPDGPWPALRAIASALVAGACVRAVYDTVRFPLALLSVPEGADPMFHLFSQGSMRTPQFFMVAACFAYAARPAAPRPAAGAWARLLWLAAGIVVHFKRGLWMAAAGAGVLMAALARRGRLLLAIALAAAACAALPPVRARWEALRSDQLKPGSRLELWRKAAPPLMRRYPHGMGWGAMRHNDLRHYVRQIEDKLNHLHNNLLQIRVELGRPGSAIWLAWMAQLVLLAALPALRMRAARDPAPAAVTLGLFGAVCGLLLNGVVEYNFGAGAILMLYALLMGMTAAAWTASAPPREKTS